MVIRLWWIAAKVTAKERGRKECLAGRSGWDCCFLLKLSEKWYCYEGLFLFLFFAHPERPTRVDRLREGDENLLVEWAVQSDIKVG